MLHQITSDEWAAARKNATRLAGDELFIALGPIDGTRIAYISWGSTRGDVYTVFPDECFRTDATLFDGLSDADACKLATALRTAWHYGRGNGYTEARVSIGRKLRDGWKVSKRKDGSVYLRKCSATIVKLV